MVDFIADYLRALHWFYDPANRDTTLKIVSDFTKLPRERFADWVYTQGKDMYRDPTGRIDAKALQANIEAQYATGFVKERIDASAFIDASLVDDADRQLDGQ
jgi:ABC-type nitrate/sulfonate/bicarbonate transport system substrate-binding protein